MIRFPMGLLPPAKHQWRAAGTALSGGQPISGAPQTADAGAGGWWVYSHQIGILKTHPQLGTWRAIIGHLRSGKRLIEIPVIDALKPLPPEGWPGPVDFGDGSTFSDGSTWRSDPTEAFLAAPGYMPASPAPPAPPSQAQIQLVAGASLNGWEYFSVIGPGGRVRLHLIDRVLDVAGDVFTVGFSPPFREDMPAGTPVDFSRPRCTMKAELGSLKGAWPEMEVPFTAKPTITFEEAAF